LAVSTRAIIRLSVALGMTNTLSKRQGMNNEILQPHERLKRVFNTHDRIQRLAIRFGLGDNIGKWFREWRGLGSGHPSPVQRVRDIIDEALLIDPSGAGARLIADDAPDYLESLMDARESDHVNSFAEARQLFKEVDEALQAMPECFETARPSELKALDIELIDIEAKVSHLRTCVRKQLGTGTLEMPAARRA
jgi:hypothetical protein